MNEIKNNKWNKALLDCVSGGVKNREDLDLDKDIDKDMLKDLTERASSPGWDGNLYKYRF